MEIKFDVEYQLGDIVYLHTDHEENKYMITDYVFSLGGGVMYVLKCSERTSEHYAEEISELSPNLLGNN